MKPRRILLFEYFHIPIWLLKDAFWMLEWRLPALCMVLPAVLFAMYIAIKSYADARLFLPNCAIFCWVTANSFWMISDFTNTSFLPLAILFFITGFIAMMYFFIKGYGKQLLNLNDN